MGDLGAANGAWGNVVWASDESGESPAHDFYMQLNDQESAKVDALFQRFATFGEIKNRERFKKLRDVDGEALFEFKLNQLRFIGAFHGRGILPYRMLFERNKMDTSRGI